MLVMIAIQMHVQSEHSYDPVGRVLYVYDRCCRDRANVATKTDPERQIVNQYWMDMCPLLTGQV
jgi:hypothetical protein